jgi:hypothetical protein
MYVEEKGRLFWVDLSNGRKTEVKIPKNLPLPIKQESAYTVKFQLSEDIHGEYLTEEEIEATLSREHEKKQIALLKLC